MSSSAHAELQTLETDVVIVGGGIAGLWLFRTLNNLGYQAVLLENKTLGGGQSTKSQGIIHGGIKYALSGNLTKASECIAGMPGRWRNCLNGEGEVDLRAARVLSEHHYMWAPGGLSRLTSFFASKALRGRVDSVKKKDLPEVFNNRKFNGKVYQLNEIVMDIASVNEALTEGVINRTLEVNWDQADHQGSTKLLAENGEIQGIEIQGADQRYILKAKRYVLTAGEGTADLLKAWGVSTPEMQLRPLHMALVKHKYPHPLYAHCLGTNIVPRLTITSHPTEDGEWVWYLGGDIAENGVKQEPEEVIARGKKELKDLLPWIDLNDAQWGTLRINRAEPKQSKLLRPDQAFCKAVGNGLVTWPTKLALAPNLADEVLKELRGAGIEPSGNDGFAMPTDLNSARHCEPFWSGCFDK
ncbi:FAD-dependent oxidoreductase [Spongorhabdus nitratireducens]